MLTMERGGWLVTDGHRRCFLYLPLAFILFLLACDALFTATFSRKILCLALAAARSSSLIAT